MTSDLWYTRIAKFGWTVELTISIDKEASFETLIVKCNMRAAALRVLLLTVVIQLSDNISALCRNSPAACTVMGKIDSIVNSQQTSLVTLYDVCPEVATAAVGPWLALGLVGGKPVMVRHTTLSLSSRTRSHTSPRQMGQHSVSDTLYESSLKVK